MPDVRRTRATLRSAELGFLGVWVNTRVHTPRRWGDPLSAGVFDFSGLVSRPLRTSCWIVGTELLRASNRLRNSRGQNRRPGARKGAPGRPNMLAEPGFPRQAWDVSLGGFAAGDPPPPVGPWNPQRPTDLLAVV